MILTDSNIFLIDRFFLRDKHYEVNKRFVGLFPEIEVGISIYTLFELLGIASFNLSEAEFSRWFYEFDEVYNMSVLYPRDLEIEVGEHFEDLSRKLFRLMANKMTYVDALTLFIGEEHEVRSIVTWNKRHFDGRTEIEVLTPEEFLEIG